MVLRTVPTAQPTRAAIADGSLALGTGQEDLGTPEGERLAATKSGLECPALGVGQLPNEQRWFHDPLFGSNHRLPRNRMRLH